MIDRRRGGVLGAVVMECLSVACVGPPAARETAGELVLATAEGVVYLDVASGRRRPGPRVAISGDSLLSPDGRRIAYVDHASRERPRAGRASLSVLDLDGGAAREVLASRRPIDLFQWSPAGRHCLIRRRVDDSAPDDALGPLRLSLIDVLAASERPLIPLGGDPFDLTWSGDGRRLAYAQSSAWGRWSIIVLDVAAASAQAVELPEPPAIFRGPILLWSSGQRSFLAHTSASISEQSVDRLWTLDPDRAS